MVLEKTLESPWDCKEIKPVNLKEIKSVLNIHWKDWCWSWSSKTLAIWCEEPTHCKRPWCWERLRQEEKGAIEDQMAGWHHWLKGHEFEQTGRWWRTGKPGVLQFMGSQRVGHNLATQQHSPLTVLWQVQVNSKGTQPYKYMYPFFSKLPSHPGCHITGSSSLSYTAGPCCLSILNTAVCPCSSQTP